MLHTAQYRTYLSHSLAEAALNFDAVVAHDTRVGPLLKNLNKQYFGKDYSKEKAVDKLTPATVDAAADIHMPLCMSNLHHHLKQDNKLKHWGRLQYGLFLKSAVQLLFLSVVGFSIYDISFLRMCRD